MYKIILASGSPRRKEILNQIGVSYLAIPSSKEENMQDLPPGELVQSIAGAKAFDIAGQTDGAAIIIGADTVVAYNGKILGKPGSAKDAVLMLKSIQNDTHEVYTGVCILIRETDGRHKKISFSCSTKVQVAPMTEEDIKAYVSTKEPMDKAGAYAVQGIFAPFITGIEGDYYNIMGFPIAEIFKRLKEEGIRLNGREYQSINNID